MRIIRTSQQAKEIREKEKAARDEMRKCPECGYSMWECGKVKTITANLKTVFQTECPVCGCIWESEEF